MSVEFRQDGGLRNPVVDDVGGAEEVGPVSVVTDAPDQIDPGRLARHDLDAFRKDEVEEEQRVRADNPFAGAGGPPAHPLRATPRPRISRGAS